MPKLECYRFLISIIFNLLFYCLLSNQVEALETDMVEIVLDPSENKTSDIWHICVEVESCYYIFLKFQKSLSTFLFNWH